MSHNMSATEKEEKAEKSEGTGVPEESKIPKRPDKTPIEIEVKIPVSNFDRLYLQLPQMGFEYRKSYEQEDSYSNSVNYDLKKRDKALRIRRTVDLETGKMWAQLNCKGPKLDKVSMSRKELEIPIDNPGAMEEILGELDFFPVHCRVKKKRYDFSCGKITASLDRVEGLGDFLELEILELGEEKRAAGLREIERVIRELGYSMEDTVRISYLSMLQKKYNEK